MKYPDDFLNKVICGNNLDILKDIPDKSIDLVLTDPPYGINLKYDNYNDTEENWFKLMDKIIPELRRVAKMVIMPCCGIPKLPFIYKNYPPDWLICWYKGSPGQRSFIGFQDWEPLLVYGKNKGVIMHDYLQCQNTEKMGSYGHPCPKPLKWCEWLISRASKETDIVLDPFCGSGTTLVASKSLNRRFIGIDISEKYCNISRERIKNVPSRFF